MTTVVYHITAPDPAEALRTAWDAEARGLAMLGLDPDDTGPRKRGHVYRVRIPAARDGRVALLGTAEEVSAGER